MPVELVIPPRLSQYANGQRHFQLPAGTLQELLEHLCSQHPDLRVRLLGDTRQLYSYFAILHNGQQLTADEAATIACRDGDQLEILTLASGG